VESLLSSCPLSDPSSSHNRGNQQRQAHAQSRAGLTQLFGTLTAVQLQPPFKLFEHVRGEFTSARGDRYSVRDRVCEPPAPVKTKTVSGTETVSCVYVFVIQQQTAIQRQVAEWKRSPNSSQLREEERKRVPVLHRRQRPTTAHACTIKPQNAQLTIQLLSLVRSPFLGHACPHARPTFYLLWRRLDRDSARLVSCPPRRTHTSLFYFGLSGFFLPFSPLFRFSSVFPRVRRACDR
jgi:hypothetical protein